MLYIKFKLTDSRKYSDFVKLYHHMIKARTTGFEEKDDVEVLSDEWTDRLYNGNSKAIQKRYEKIIPEYALKYLRAYTGFDAERAEHFAFGMRDIFNYLESNFEVNLDDLKKLDETTGIVKFSSGNYPFGGMERFIITLKAFGLLPTECFNGFTIYKFDWVSEYEHEGIELPDKTKTYLASFKNS